MWKRKDEMKIRNRQKFLFPGFKPTRLDQLLALGAMAVAAGVVGGPLETATIATLEMSAQGGGAAGRDGPHDF